jgi:hypothetical protein
MANTYYKIKVSSVEDVEQGYIFYRKEIRKLPVIQSSIRTYKKRYNEVIGIHGLDNLYIMCSKMGMFSIQLNSPYYKKYLDVTNEALTHTVQELGNW